MMMMMMMMMTTTTRNKAYNLHTYSVQSGDSFLLDTNVWLYFLHPAPSSGTTRLRRLYSRGLKSILSAGGQLVIDVLVLSEYLNRYCRIAWEAHYRRRRTDFKAFRKSSDFLNVGRRAALGAHEILNQSKRVDHPFARTNIAQVLADFETGANDFNDGLLADACRRNDWKLVTHDADFTTGGIEVLTMNRKLLEACP